MLGGALLCLLSAGSCNYQPLESIALSTVGSSYYCGRIQFTITSPTTVSANWPDNPCGGDSPLALVRTLVFSWSEANGRTLTMPLRIINQGTLPLHLPIRMILAISGKTVMLPAETSSSTMVPQNQDSTRTDGTTVWLVGGTGTVAAGDSTSVRTILFRIDSPVTKGRLLFTINAETADLVPLVPPDSEPAWFANDSSYLDSGRGLLKSVLLVRFDPAASQAERQVAIDSVVGTVIGGVRFGASDGFYEIAVPNAVTLSGLDSVLVKLRRQPRVLSVGYVGKFRSMGVRPNDGAG
jgi:hypothetical protein